MKNIKSLIPSPSGKSRLVRGFTLIEILIATLIFMLVAMIGTATFAVVRNTSNRTEDLQNANQCSRQIENLVESLTRSSWHGYGKRIMGIAKSEAGASYVLKDLYQSDAPQRFYGAAFFVAFDRYRIVIKEDGSDSYLIKDFGYTGADEIENNKIVDPGGGVPLVPDDCAAFVDQPEPFNSMNLTQPFSISVQPNSPQLKTQTPSSNPSYFDSLSYKLNLDDVVYMKNVETQKESINRKTYEQVYVSATNSLRGI